MKESLSTNAKRHFLNIKLERVEDELSGGIYCTYEMLIYTSHFGKNGMRLQS